MIGAAHLTLAHYTLLSAIYSAFPSPEYSSITRRHRAADGGQVGTAGGEHEFCRVLALLGDVSGRVFVFSSTVAAAGRRQAQRFWSFFPQPGDDQRPANTIR
jgi:hypothetical protein